MNRGSEGFLILFCNNCGYEEEVYYKEVERRGIHCPECSGYVDYEEIDVYDEVLQKEDLEKLL